ncbi:MAG: hypothetical protein FIA97_17185 [Methylococcaceae bacterium]|nr:hypothetical protein [Methylococcaceae bacterium]
MNRPDSNLLRNRLTILAIALTVVVPFGAAWYLAQHPDLARTGKPVNLGRLIDPAQPIGLDELLRHPLSGEETSAEFKGHWLMLQPLTGAGCGDACRAAAEKTGRIRVMLNKELSRVRRVLLVAAPADQATLGELPASDPTLLLTELNAELRSRLERAVGQPLDDGMLILMDPLGNVMLWYPAGFDPYAPLKDLQRLLRISQIG